MSRKVEKLISLVEDDDDIANLVAYHLQSKGFRTHRPTEPFRVISDAEKDPPVLFILDLLLPGSDGFQICGSIRQHPTLRDVPILILTASTAPSDRKRALESGADYYMTKPFKPSALIAAVRALSDDNHSRKD